MGPPIYWARCARDIPRLPSDGPTPMAYLRKHDPGVEGLFLDKARRAHGLRLRVIRQGEETAESDLDIAVYIAPEGPDIEWEETRDYETEDEIWSSVEKIVGRDTDLIVLNRAPLDACLLRSFRKASPSSSRTLRSACGSPSWSARRRRFSGMVSGLPGHKAAFDVP